MLRLIEPSMRIGIVGGGFTGLAAAYELTKHGHNVTLFEKEKYLGGLAYGFRQPNWNWYLEGAYHHWFTNDNAILGLIDELGLTNKLIIKRPITASLYRRRPYQLDSPGNLFRFPGLSIADKLRTAALLAFLKLTPFWKPLESITAKQLLLSIGGKNAYKTLWNPLLVGKFNDHADAVSAAWFWARIKKRTTQLAYMEGGFHTLIEALERAIKTHGGIIHTDTAIPAITSRNSQFSILNSQFDKILLTVPSGIAIKIAHFKLNIKKIPHLYAQTLILETKEPILKDVYWLNVTDRSFPFLAAVAHTNFMDKKHYGGRHITYVGNYLPDGHPYLSMDKKQLFTLFLPYIKRLAPHHSQQWHNNITMKQLHLFTGAYAQPVHTLHYSRRAPTLVTNIPGVYLANIDNIYPWDRGTNYAVELGIRAAHTIMQKT